MSCDTRSKEFPYEDIIHLPHHQSESRAHMPIADRAAQFAPFAALTGHGAAIQKTAEEQVKKVTEYKEELMVEDGEVITVKEIFDVGQIK